MNHLILASASPRRQELLRLITEEFTVVPADADETLPAGLSVANQIEVLAERKAASASPRRQELLRLITEEFTVVPADADETLPAGLSVANQIEVLAERKAADIFAKHPDSVVIGSDTMVVIDGQPLGKPADAEDARRMLKILSGRTHEVITGLAVLSPTGKKIGHRTTKVQFRNLADREIERYLASGRTHEVITGLAVLSPTGKKIGHRTTKVQFRNLADREIERYLATGEPLDKAGAYGIQGKGATLITGIDGDYFSVVGLPVSMLYTMLDELGQLE